MTVSRDIQLKVIADAAGFQKEIMKIPGMTEKSAASAALRMSKEMHKGFQKVGKDAEKSGKQIGGALSVAVGTALAEIGLRMAQAFDPRQLTELIKAAADTQNQLSDLSAETGLTVQQLALMRLGASSAGKELSTLEGAGAPELAVTQRGLRRSFGFSLRVPSASSLALLRSAIKEDERVQMVF